MAQSKGSLFLAFLRQVMYIIITIAVVSALFWLFAMPEIERRTESTVSRSLDERIPPSVAASVKQAVDEAVGRDVPVAVQKILAERLAGDVGTLVQQGLPGAVQPIVDRRMAEIEETTRQKLEIALYQSVLNSLEKKVPEVVDAAVAEQMTKLQELAQKVYAEAEAVRAQHQEIEEEIRKAAVEEVAKIEEQQFFVINVTGSGNDINIEEGGSDLMNAVGPMVTVTGKYGEPRVLANPERPVKLIITGKFNNIFVPKSIQKRLVVDDRAGSNKIIVKTFWNLYGKSEDLNKLGEME